MTVREAVIIACREQGLSLKRLSEKVGIPQGNLSRSLSIFRGDGERITVAMLIRLMDALGADIVIQTKRGEDYVLDGYEDGVLDEDE